MTEENKNELTEKRQPYSPSETAQIKFDTVNAIVNAQSKLLQRASNKTDLNDLPAVKQVAMDCMKQCADLGVLPNFELLAAALGYCRRGLYSYIERHGDTETAAFIDQLRTAWAAMRQMAADRGAVSETMSIFVLLNSSLGFTNKHDVEITQVQNPLGWNEQTDEELACKYLYSAVKTEMDD